MQAVIQRPGHKRRVLFIGLRSTNKRVRQYSRTKAPSGATAVRMQTSALQGDTYNDDAPSTPQLIVTSAKENWLTWQDSMSIETNPAGE